MGSEEGKIDGSGRSFEKLNSSFSSPFLCFLFSPASRTFSHFQIFGVSLALVLNEKRSLFGQSKVIAARSASNFSFFGNLVSRQLICALS